LLAPFRLQWYETGFPHWSPDMVKLTVVILPILLYALCAPVQASQSGMNVQTRAFAEQAAEIRAAIRGPEYSEMADADRSLVLGLLDRMETMVGSVDTLDALSSQQRIDLFNDQGQLNAILTGAREDSRLICRRTQVTGSHRKQQVCATRAELDRKAAADRENLDRYRSMRTDPGRPLEP
jgi:hypothetical protein